MPHVTIQINPGKSDDQKQQLADAIVEDFVRLFFDRSFWSFCHVTLLYIFTEFDLSDRTEQATCVSGGLFKGISLAVRPDLQYTASA